MNHTISLAPLSKPCIHGESPVWIAEEHSLYWADVQEHILHRLDLHTAVQSEWRLPRRICSFAARKSGGLIASLEDGVYFLDLKTQDCAPAAKAEGMSQRLRFNDAKCDRSGRYWTGTMDDKESEALGALYRFDPPGSLVQADGPFTAPNGPAFSPDGKRMYVCDSPARKIYACDYDQGSGFIQNRRVFADTHERPGFPDGITVDSEGCLWCAYWGGWQVVRHAPDGAADRVIELPVSQPSSCAFGGEGMLTLFITSASRGLSNEDRAAQPNAGCTFAIEASTPGIPEPRFEG